MNESARTAAARGLAFLKAQHADLEAAIVDCLWFNGDPQAVVGALKRFQNDDGGFGKRLEVDIAAPESNPFATRLALGYLRDIPRQAGAELLGSVGPWLRENQALDGDWHFSEATRAGELAPWFAAWTFPSLNPACCLAGLATALDIATPEMVERVGVLFAAQASVETVRTGEFYDLVPYIEYSLTGSLPVDYVDAIAETITRWAREDRFEDAEHFFNLAFGGSAELSARIPAEMVQGFVARALAEQLDDGGWPTPYDPAWRPAATVGVLRALARAVRE